MPLIYTTVQRDSQSGEKRKREEDDAERGVLQECEGLLSAMYAAVERADTPVQYERLRQRALRVQPRAVLEPDQEERSGELDEREQLERARWLEEPEQPVQISLISSAQAQAEIEAQNQDDNLPHNQDIDRPTALPRGTFQDYVRVAEAVLNEIERGHFPECSNLSIEHTLLGQMARVFLDSQPPHLFFDERTTHYNWWPVVQYMRTFGIRWFAEQFSCFLHERASEHRRQRERRERREREGREREGRERYMRHRRRRQMQASMLRQEEVEDDEIPERAPEHGRVPSIVLR